MRLPVAMEQQRPMTMKVQPITMLPLTFERARKATLARPGNVGEQQPRVDGDDEQEGRQHLCHR